MKQSVLVCELLMLTCGVFAGSEKPLTLTVNDNGKTLSAKVGQDIVISLKGNITTGYSWAVGRVTGDAVAAVGDVVYKTDEHAPGMVGVGGIFTAKFKAAKAGKATVTLEYRRPWEKNQKPAQVFEVSLTVAK